MRLILYSKPDCHLCEGLQEKLAQIHNLKIELEIRDITTRQDWFKAYQYEVPLLFKVEVKSINEAGEVTSSSEELLPRLSPRCTVAKLEQMLQRYSDDPAHVE
jgi:hypothetical protein